MGGGVLRIATKATALGSYRPALGRTASTVGLKPVPMPPPSASAVADSVPISINQEESKGLNESANPAISQWEFAGWKSDLEDIFEYLPPPRLVFSPVPILEEALEAIGDLTCALERANEHEQMGIFQNNAIRPAMPRGVAQAYSLLQTSTETQSVVASLVSDEKVWDAVLKNEKLIEFFHNYQSSLSEDPLGVSLNTNQNKSEEIHSEAGKDPHGSNGFSKFVNKVKVKAMEVMNNISNFIQDDVKVKAMEFVNNISNLIQDFFETKDRADGSEAGSTFQSFLSPNTFYGLAIAVIFVVLVKRA